MHKKMDRPWQKPDLEHVWEIEDITDPNRFMQFVFDISPLGSTWVINGAWEQDTIDLLQPLTLKIITPRKILGLFIRPAGEIEIALTAETKKKLAMVVPQLNLQTEFTEQHVYRGQHMIMVSYDNLAPCWLANELPHNKIEEASLEIGFRFFDPSDA